MAEFLKLVGEECVLLVETMLCAATWSRRLFVKNTGLRLRRVDAHGPDMTVSTGCL
jgi:hypothetical protein